MGGSETITSSSCSAAAAAAATAANTFCVASSVNEDELFRELDDAFAFFAEEIASFGVNDDLIDRLDEDAGGGGGETTVTVGSEEANATSLFLFFELLFGVGTDADFFAETAAFFADSRAASAELEEEGTRSESGVGERIAATAADTPALEALLAFVALGDAAAAAEAVENRLAFFEEEEEEEEEEGASSS